MSTPKKTVTTKAKATGKPAGGESEAIKVVPKRAGFRRAGFAFPEGGLTIPLSELSEDQLEQLETEPMLVTMRVGIEPPAENPAAPESSTQAANAAE